MQNTKRDFKFITTQDSETAHDLKISGYQLLNESDGEWVFINKKDLALKFDSKKVSYTNVLNF